MAFYYRCVFGNEGLTDEEMDRVAEEMLASHDGILGFVFEDICAQFMGSRGRVGTWWGIDRNTRTREEIDLVVKSEEGDRKVMTFCECKYTSWTVGMNAVSKLRERSALVGGADERRYAVFSRSGFTDDVRGDPGVESYTLDDMVDLGGRAPARRTA